MEFFQIIPQLSHSHFSRRRPSSFPKSITPILFYSSLENLPSAEVKFICFPSSILKIPQEQDSYLPGSPLCSWCLKWYLSSSRLFTSSWQMSEQHCKSNQLILFVLCKSSLLWAGKKKLGFGRLGSSFRSWYQGSRIKAQVRLPAQWDISASPSVPPTHGCTLHKCTFSLSLS